jgi:hypothetical protein
MIKILVLWITGIIFGYICLAVKTMYSPSKKAADFFLTLFLMLTLGIHLAAVYFTALRSPFFSMIAIMVFDYYWFYFTPYYPHSDPAGNGMARAFHSIFITIGSVLLGIVSVLLIKFIAFGGKQQGLYFVLFVAACIGLLNIFSSRRSFISGDIFEEDARWARMSVDDYRKTMFRIGMVEKNDSLQAKELDASPKELEHFDVYGCKCINIKTDERFECILVEGIFDFPAGTEKARRTGLLSGCLGYTDAGDANDRTTFVPKSMKLVWYYISEGKTYKIETGLPKELDRYFEDTDRFWLDDIEFRIMPRGKVLMFHNRVNQIHNIMIDHPLESEETSEYDSAVADLIQKMGIDVNKYSGVKTPTLEIINNYLKRFRYSISFHSENNRYKITKTICNFFNGEKILSDGKWKEDMDPARIKDVFLRFEDEQSRYAGFIYFNEEEILDTFKDAFENSTDMVQGEFSIICGDTLNAFSFALKAGDESYMLTQTQIRLYEVNADERGKLVFKNYKGNINKMEIIA